MAKKIIITVARQYGSGGREIGEKIAAEQEWHLSLRKRSLHLAIPLFVFPLGSAPYRLFFVLHSVPFRPLCVLRSRGAFPLPSFRDCIILHLFVSKGLNLSHGVSTFQTFFRRNVRGTLEER